MPLSPPPPPPPISGPSILARVKVLASDEFEGRAPASAGEEKTVAYLVSEFKKIGLAPGNPNGTYLQNVPMIGITSHPTATFTAGTQTFSPTHLIDYVALSKRVTAHVDVKASEIVFVGYGISAPEFGWDDYKGLDVRGKTVVMLINDPPVTTAAGQLDPKVFGGKAMTYYGRWTYKYEIASAKGAAACLIVHETGPAGYPFAVVTGSWGPREFRSPHARRQRLPRRRRSLAFPRFHEATIHRRWPGLRRPQDRRRLARLQARHVESPGHVLRHQHHP